MTRKLPEVNKEKWLVRMVIPENGVEDLQKAGVVLGQEKKAGSGSTFRVLQSLTGSFLKPCDDVCKLRVIKKGGY